ncbi:hypothetical protein SAY87_019487 [Trapa incisa]|uniref:Uncharacterized protein n=1 Tax=Trapa incisa TaxID=236973 RepID=A0AAN7K1R7_9MYRT|nr:hypothetical protein SAY87_019487 [Trapa incisa]
MELQVCKMEPVPRELVMNCSWNSEYVTSLFPHNVGLPLPGEFSFSAISSLTMLQNLSLSTDQLTGNISESAFRFSQFVSTIRYLNVSNNFLVGELIVQDGMPYFDSLEVVDASNNQLVGKLPEFEFVVSLKVLHLGNNQLSGYHLPAFLQGNSMVLSELDLSRNQLECTLCTLFTLIQMKHCTDPS